jgi:uncharacterized protein YbaR (Trm112 family)
MELTFLIKIVRTFLTSLIIHMSKKLVLYVDAFFSNATNDAANAKVVCNNCGSSYRIHILNSINELEKCPDCRTDLNINKEVLSNYESRNGDWAGNTRRW